MHLLGCPAMFQNHNQPWSHSAATSRGSSQACTDASQHGTTNSRRPAGTAGQARHGQSRPDTTPREGCASSWRRVQTPLGPKHTCNAATFTHTHHHHHHTTPHPCQHRATATHPAPRGSHPQKERATTPNQKSICVACICALQTPDTLMSTIYDCSSARAGATARRNVDNQQETPAELPQAPRAQPEVQSPKPQRYPAPAQTAKHNRAIRQAHNPNPRSHAHPGHSTRAEHTHPHGLGRRRVGA